MSDFAKFNLDEKILKLLKDIQFNQPTAIQEQAIPKILSGSDIIASAQTGTGKTGAFMLPILHLLEMNPVEKHIKPRVLVLVPTRELALQVSDETKKFSKYLPQIRTVCIYGGIPYPIQKRALSCHYDILIATPGRLMDHIDQQRIDLSNVQILVLDEADRMLDMGFIDDVEQITAFMPKKRQTLLFSATIDNKILPISRKLQNNPFEIKVKQDLSLKDNIDASLYYVDDIQHKMRLLDHFLENEPITQMIIFTSTIVQTKALARHLMEKDYKAGALHGDMDQKQRTKTLNRLRKGAMQILVATDVAARGIDIASLSHVINFDLPFQPEDFVHRIGRTGRAGASGSAITFATYKESLMMSRIEKTISKPLPVLTIEGLEPKPRTKENSMPIQRGRRSPSRFAERSGSKGFKKPFQSEKPRFQSNKADEPRIDFSKQRERKKSFEKESNDFDKPFKSERSFRDRPRAESRSSFNQPFKSKPLKSERNFRDEPRTESRGNFDKPFKSEREFKKPFQSERNFRDGPRTGSRGSFGKPFKSEREFKKPFQSERNFRDGPRTESRGSFGKPFKSERAKPFRDDSATRKDFKIRGKTSFKKPFEKSFDAKKAGFKTLPR